MFNLNDMGVDGALMPPVDAKDLRAVFKMMVDYATQNSQEVRDADFAGPYHFASAVSRVQMSLLFGYGQTCFILLQWKRNQSLSISREGNSATHSLTFGPSFRFVPQLKPVEVLDWPLTGWKKS
jgi:hypothetical protein